MGYTTTTLSATTGASPALSVSWQSGRPWSAVVTTSAQSTGAFTVQYTLQDITSTSIGLTAPSWLNLTGANGLTGLSSAVTSSAGYQTLLLTSSTIDVAAGLLVWGLYPIAGLRLNSTANSGVLVLNLLQSQ